MDRESITEQRLEFACEAFKENNIEFKVVNASIGHINLYKNKRVVISFYAYTGAVWCPEFNIKKDDMRGIHNCIKLYNESYKEKQNGI